MGAKYDPWTFRAKGSYALPGDNPLPSQDANLVYFFHLWLEGVDSGQDVLDEFELYPPADDGAGR